ncbi:hypothetical protein CKAH01_06286 [Colletotrichum kahawae]|uniref:Uncharacterized protein n=1 Tax=Colletotrichum kahawae TaxID=34407 RepID=A0AAD9YAR9_COLKA|nr:hypothetical protein CKAH01_06286 [Colletotrichum kahawae]
MHRNLFLLPAFLLLANPVSAVTWYFLRYYPASGQKFTSFSGDMVIPTLQQAGVYYLWPGLQPTDNSGVYQNVLDGRSGTWWFGSGWCCSNPSLPWGGGFNTYGGGDGLSNGQSVANDFALADKSFNQVLFAIELYDVSWDFGPLEFKNIVITSEGSSDSSWCNSSPQNYNSATTYTMSGGSASVSGTTVTCTIQSVTLQSPA